jgi:6-methylsalicylate decarboxylase
MTTTLIDVHAHFLTERYVAEATAAGHATPDGMPRWPQWSPEDHLRLMDTAGIERSILSISSPGVHFGDDAAARALARHTAEFAADVISGHPDRFGQFLSLPLPDVAGSLELLDEFDADGVSILSNALGNYPGSATFDPLFDELDARGALVLLHPTSPPNVATVDGGRPAPMVEFLFDSARAVVDLVFADRIRRHPNIRWLITHGGGVLPLVADRVDEFALLSGAGRRIDLAEELRTCWFDSAGTALPHQLPVLSGMVGTDHLAFGSDFCFTPAPAVTRQVASLGTWRDVLADGAQRLVGDRTPKRA